MFILGHLFGSLALLCSMIFKILYFLLVIRIILSWFAVDIFREPYNTLYRITEPLLAPFRSLPLQIGAIDLSPILAFLVLTFLDNFVTGVFSSLAIRFGS